MIKKILLTGATGFIGSHLLDSLIKKDYKVIITKRKSSDTWRIGNLLDKIKIYDIDEVDSAVIFQENKIDCILHLATNYIKSHQGAGDVKQMIDDNVKFPDRKSVV